VKNTAGKKVKWTSSNKKVVTVSKKGKVVAKKKGSAIITVKVKGSKTLRCKVTVKDKRKAVSNKPNSNTDENNSNDNNNNSNTTCQHTWVTKYVDEEVTVNGCRCACGEVFTCYNEWHEHSTEAALNHEYGHGSYSDTDVTTTVTKTKYVCSKCGAEKE